MVQGLRVVFSPDPGARYAHRVPEPGTRGSDARAHLHDRLHAHGIAH